MFVAMVISFRLVGNLVFIWRFQDHRKVVYEVDLGTCNIAFRLAASSISLSHIVSMRNHGIEEGPWDDAGTLDHTGRGLLLVDNQDVLEEVNDIHVGFQTGASAPYWLPPGYTNALDL